LQELLEVQDFFDLPSPALVEKDFYVTKALAAIANLDVGPSSLVLGGGTSLCRAYRLIKRMSEDVDLKIVSDQKLKRPELRIIRDQITNSLLEAGFLFNPEDRAQRDSGNASEYTIFRLPYSPLTSGEGVLRPAIQIEVIVSSLRLPAQKMPLQSFVSEALNRPAEVEGVLCVSINQTAAEKFVALTRRTAAEIADAGGKRDQTLGRHIYDLHITRSHYDPADVMKLAKDIMQTDAAVYGNQFPAYRDNPIATTIQAVNSLQTLQEYADRYVHFHREMVYGESVTYETCLKTLQELVEAL